MDIPTAQKLLEKYQSILPADQFNRLVIQFIENCITHDGTGGLRYVSAAKDLLDKYPSIWTNSKGFSDRVVVIHSENSDNQQLTLLLGRVDLRILNQASPNLLSEATSKYTINNFENILKLFIDDAGKTPLRFDPQKFALLNNDIFENKIYLAITNLILKKYITDSEIRNDLIELICGSCDLSLIPAELKKLNHYATNNPDLLPRNLKAFNTVYQSNLNQINHNSCSNSAICCAFDANKIPITTGQIKQLACTNSRSDETCLKTLKSQFYVDFFTQYSKGANFIDLIDRLRNNGQLKHGVLVSYISKHTGVGHREFVYEDNGKLCFSTSQIVTISGKEHYRFAWIYQTATTQETYWNNKEQVVDAIWSLTPKIFIVYGNLPSKNRSITC